MNPLPFQEPLADQIPNLRKPVVEHLNNVRPEIDFRAPQLIENDFSLIGVGQRFMGGIFQGFTTINLQRGSEPANVAEGIAQSLGTWLGITGMFLGGPKAWGARFFAQGASRGSRMAASMAKSNFRSIPIYLGDKAVQGIKHVGRQASTPAMREFVRNNRLHADAVEGAVRIGTAMGVVSWQEGVNAMLFGAGLGAFFGGSDRVIGNAIKNMGPQIRAQLKGIEKMSPTEQAIRLRKAERAVSMVSAGIVSGMPSTLMGQPLEYQIYDYLFGAWLGAEPSYAMRTAHSMIGRSRQNGEMNDLFSTKRRKGTKVYKEMLEKNKNQRVRDHIDEEITAQADFFVGQKINSYNKMHIIAAMADAAAKSGKATPEQVLEMNQHMFSDSVEGGMIAEGQAKYQAEAEADGMTPSQAEAYAMERVREEYFDWRSSKKPSKYMAEWAEEITVFTPDKKDYTLYSPTQVGDDIGIISKINSDGTVLTVLGADGVELVQAGKVLSVDEIAAIRAKNENIHNIDRQAIVNKIVAWRYAVDEDGKLINQGENAETDLNIDERIWEYFPGLEANYKQPSFFLDADGKYYPEIMIAGKTYQRLPYSFESEKAAYRYALDHITTTSRERKLNQDPSQLHEVGILKRLYEEYSKPEHNERSRPILEIVSDLIKDLDIKDQLKTREDIYTNPFLTYRKIMQALIKTRDTNNKRLELTKELAKAQKDQSPNRDQRIKEVQQQLDVLRDLYGSELGWGGFLDTMRSQFPMKQGERDYWTMDNPTIRDLRKWYKDYTSQKQVKSLVLVQKAVEFNEASRPKKFVGKLEAMDAFPSGQRNVQMKAPSILQRTLHSINQSYDVIHIDNVLDGTDVMRLNQSEMVTRENINKYLDRLFRKGELSHRYYVASGVKDKDTLRALPFLFKNKSRATSYLEGRMKQMLKTNKKDEIGLGIRDLLKTNDGRQIMEYASNMRLWEKLNNDSVGRRKVDGKNKYKYPIEFMANQEGFIKTVAAMNKRLQIIDAEGQLTDPLFYTNKDGSRKSEFRMMVVDVLADIQGIDPFMANRGTDAEYRADQHGDGAVLVDQRTFDQMVADGGIDPASGAIKGVTAFSDIDGAFFGKYAMFRATDDVQTFMEANNIDFLHNTTTAKQVGDRQVYKLNLDKSGNTIITDGQQTVIPQTYSVPFDGVTINSGQSESIKSAMKRQGLPVQMMQAFSPHVVDRMVAEQTINEVMNMANQTTGKAAEFLYKIEKLDMLEMDAPVSKKLLTQLREEAQAIDVYDMSIKDIFRVLNGDPIYSETGLYDAVIRQMHKAKEDILTDNIADGMDEAGFKALSNEHASNLDLLLEVRSPIEQPITPYEINQRSLRAYADAVYRNFVVSRAMRPKMNYSLKSIGSSQDPWFLQKYGRVEQGEFMLGQGARSMRIKVGTRTSTLGETFDNIAKLDARHDNLLSEMETLETAMGKFKTDRGKTYKELKRQWDTLESRRIKLNIERAEHREAMDMIITRVPIEHVSGVRSLRFKGFTDERGVTSKLNPDDMANLGGMDLDIDSVFIFQNVGKTKYKAEDGTMKSMHDELKDPKSKEYWQDQKTGKFIEPKNPEMEAFWKAVYDKTRNPNDMFDSAKLYEAGRGTAEANSALGLIVNARRDLLAMIDKMPKQVFKISDMEGLVTEGQYKRLIKTFGDAEITFSLKQDASKIIDEIARAGINMSADAADLTSFVQKFDIKKMMHQSVYDMQIGLSKGKKKPKPDQLDIGMDIIRGNNPGMKILQMANQALSGKVGDNTNADAMMMISQLRTLDLQLREFNAKSGIKDTGLSDLHGSYYKSIKQILDTEYYYKPLDDIHMNNLNKFYKLAGKFLNMKSSPEGKDPTSLRRSKLATYFKGVLKDITGVQRRVYDTAYTKFVGEYNKAVIAFNKGELSIHKLKRAHDNLVDIVANDFNDLTSALVLYREAHSILQNGYLSNGQKVKLNEMQTFDKLREIFDKASEIKREMFFYKKGADTNKNMDALSNDWKAYRARLPEGLRRFADMAGMSTLFRKGDSPLPKLTAEDTKTMTDAEIAREENLRNVFTNHMHQSEFMKHASGQSINDFFLSFRKISELPYAPDAESLDAFGRKMRPELEIMLDNILADATRGDMDILFPYDYQDRPAPKRVDMRIAELKKRAETQKGRKYEADENPNYLNEESYAYNTLLAQHTRALKALSKYIAEGNEFKLSAEETKLFYDLQDLFIRHPQVADKFDMVFSGELFFTRRDGRPIEYKDAIMDDLRKFMAAARGHYHGDLLQKQVNLDKIPRWMYWMVPDKYHRTYVNVDLQLDPVMIPTVKGGGKLGYVISSPAKRLVTFANNIQLAIEIKNADMTTEIASMMDGLHADLGKDYDTIHRYTVLKRKVERGQPSEDDLKEYANLTKRFNEIDTKYYVHNDKKISKINASEVLDATLTEMNKRVWRLIHNSDQPRYFYANTQRWVDANTVISKMTQSMLADDINKLWIPDTWTLNNIVMQQYVHSKIKADLGNNTPEIGSNTWLILANKFIDNAQMNAVLDMPPLPFDSYYPQRNHSKKALREWRVEQKKKQRALTMEQKREKQYAAMRLYKDNGLAETFTDDGIYADIIGLAPAEYNTGSSQLAGHLRKRSDASDQIPQWDPGMRSYFEYVNSLVKNNYNKALSLVGAKQINDMEVRLRETMGDKSSHYADFLRMYLSDQVMTQTMIPKIWTTNYASLNLKDSGYYYFTDRYYTELDKKVSKMLGTKALLQDNDPLRPLRLSEIANLEAKYSLMTLLSRPKTGVMNLYGGGTILASDVGITNAMKGWRLKEIQKVNPALKTWDQAMAFAEANGAMESLIRYEVMESPGWRSKNSRKALDEMLRAIKRDPTTSDLKLTEIAKRYGLSDTIMNVAAFPMRYSERLLRTRSFFAHYIKAVNVLEVTGPSAENHPWALHMAKRGVATTQFLYNNAHRPAFARSNVGKIFSRFKMWAINSVKFRADAFNEMAADAHYNVGDPKTHKRFNDIMMMDMFMIALAGLYPFSVFGNSIPEPFNWMNELVKWAFGDREEAFRGGSGLPTPLAPLAVTLPPSSRMLTAWIDPVLKDEWGTFSGYQVWTLFPFGLLARDSRNALRSPERAIDRLTGLPVGEAIYQGRQTGRSENRTPLEEVLPMSVE